MSLSQSNGEPFNPELNHPELLHRALENELEVHEVPVWETLRLEPEILKTVSNLEFVARELRALPREHAPPGLALNLSRRISELLPEVAPGSLEMGVATLPKLRAPEGFAAHIAAKISLASDEQKQNESDHAAALEQSVRTLSRPSVPAGFAAGIAAKISLEAQPFSPPPLQASPSVYQNSLIASEPRDSNLTPLYFLASMLLALLLAAFALLVPSTPGLARSLLEGLGGLTPALILTLLAAGAFVLLASSARLKASSTFAGMGVLGAAFVAQLGPSVAGFQASIGPQTVPDLGSATLPLLSAANALRSLENIVRSSEPRWLLLGVVAVLTFGLAFARHIFEDQLESTTDTSSQAFGIGAGVLIALFAFTALLVLTPLAPLAALTLGLFASLVTLGFSFALLELGRILAQAARWTSSPWPVSPWLGASLGLVPFAASCTWFPLALIECLIGGAWGAGAIMLAWRAGRLRLPGQLLE
jgi:hypothetical protein